MVKRSKAIIHKAASDILKAKRDAFILNEKTMAGHPDPEAYPLSTGNQKDILSLLSEYFHI